MYYLYLINCKNVAVAGGLIMNIKKDDMMMGSVPQSTITTTSSPPPHMYPEELQLKLYQAFIFSIPILFSIILFLLFYLFYLKRRASSFSPHLLPRINPPSITYRYYSSSSVSLLLNSFHHLLNYFLFFTC